VDGVMRLRLRRVPRVLCYHAIADLAGDPVLEQYSVPLPVFREQLDSLRRAGYRYICADELLAYLEGRGRLPRRALLLTFDDCYLDLLEDVLPELLRRGIPAVAFAISGQLGGDNHWDQQLGGTALRLLDTGGLAALAHAGVEIGAHSRSHRRLTQVGGADLPGETAGAAEDLRRAGLPAPRLFAYPFGDRSAQVQEAVACAGYRAAFTVSPGRVHRGSDPFAIPRVDIRRHHRGWRLRLRVALAGGGRLRRWLRWLKAVLPQRQNPITKTMTEAADAHQQQTTR